jgi:hypothetical protein
LFFGHSCKNETARETSGFVRLYGDLRPYGRVRSGDREQNPILAALLGVGGDLDHLLDCDRDEPGVLHLKLGSGAR